jgi:hypothetical protein
MDTTQPSPAEMLSQQLLAARAYDESLRERAAGGDVIHIPETGRTISAAYEQLRNATEYSEEHLRMQRAIRRFYKRSFFLLKKRPQEISQELIVELSLAGYLKSDQFGTHAVQAITSLTDEQLHLYGRMREAHVPQGRAMDWTLGVMSVKTEQLLNPHSYHAVLISFVYNHFLQQFNKDQLAHTPAEYTAYETSLYVAVHRELIKSDIDTIRTDLLRSLDHNVDTQTYVAQNEYIQKLYTSSLTLRLRRIVSRNSAPFRILKAMVEENQGIATALTSPEQFLPMYSNQIEKEYAAIDRRLTNGVIRSVIFLLITKTIIGLGVEVPSDLALYGTVAILPLVINLLFPPLYMATMRLGVTMPTSKDASATQQYMSDLLYYGKVPLFRIREPKPFSFFRKIIYTLLFFVPFAAVLYLLQRLAFSPVQMVIFFIFFSTASFLGFRLSNMARELKLARRQSGILTIMQDFFYLPFIRLGQWLAGKYAKVNAINEFLDIAIELPLTSALRFTRLTLRFLNEKHEEFYY